MTFSAGCKSKQKGQKSNFSATKIDVLKFIFAQAHSARYMQPLSVIYLYSGDFHHHFWIQLKNLLFSNLCVVCCLVDLIA